MKWLFPVLALLFIALIAIPGFLQKWLWMRQLDYAGIFWTLFSLHKIMATAPDEINIGSHFEIIDAVETAVGLALIGLFGFVFGNYVRNS